MKKIIKKPYWHQAIPYLLCVLYSQGLLSQRRGELDWLSGDLCMTNLWWMLLISLPTSKWFWIVYLTECVPWACEQDCSYQLCRNYDFWGFWLLSRVLGLCSYQLMCLFPLSMGNCHLSSSQLLIGYTGINDAQMSRIRPKMPGMGRAARVPMYFVKCGVWYKNIPPSLLCTAEFHLFFLFFFFSSSYSLMVQALAFNMYNTHEEHIGVYSL